MYLKLKRCEIQQLHCQCRRCFDLDYVGKLALLQLHKNKICGIVLICFRVSMRMVQLPVEFW